MLLETIFPWVEEEQDAYAKQLNEHGRKATDYVLKNFLEVLAWFRTIILQDAAVLFSKYPKCALWTFAPFNTCEFQDFAKSSISILARAEEEARRKLERLPETVATSMRGVVEAMEIRQNQDRSDINTKLDYVQSLILSHVSSKPRTKGSQVAPSRSTGSLPFRYALVSKLTFFYRPNREHRLSQPRQALQTLTFRFGFCQPTFS